MEQSTKLRDALNEYDSEFRTCQKLNESRNSSLLRPAPSAFLFCQNILARKTKRVIY